MNSYKRIKLQSNYGANKKKEKKSGIYLFHFQCLKCKASESIVITPKIRMDEKVLI